MALDPVIESLTSSVLVRGTLTTRLYPIVVPLPQMVAHYPSTFASRVKPLTRCPRATYSRICTRSNSTAF